VRGYSFPLGGKIGVPFGGRFAEWPPWRRGVGAPALPATALDLIFTASEVLDARVTASGGANATRVNASGVLVAATTPRFDYDPATLFPLGVYAEAAATNIQLQSNGFGAAPWAGTDSTITANNIASPDGTVNGALVTEGSAGTALVSNAQLTVTSGLIYSVSRYFKYGNSRWICMCVTNPSFANGGQVWFDIQNGVVGTSQALGTGTALVGRIFPAGNGWYRCVVTVNMGAITGMLCRCWSAINDFSLVRQSGATYYMYGAQVEQIAVPTSYIPTTAASVTRTADSLLMTGTNFSAWYNAAAGSIAVEHDLNGFGGVNNPLFSIDDATANNKITAARTTPGVASLAVTTASVAQVAHNTANTASATATAKVAAAWALNDFSLVLNGGAAALDAAGTIPTVTQMRLGGVTPVAAALTGHLRRVRYWNTRLTDAQLQQASA
jgi:hypothetical protein